MSDGLDADMVRYLAGEADAASQARLTAALRADPDARGRFAELARLHGHLSEIGRRSADGEVDTARLLAPELPPDEVLVAPVQRPRRRWLAWGAAAAACLVLSTAILGLAVIGARTRALMPTVEYALGTIEVQRDGGTIQATAGLRLRAGDRVAIGEGGALGVVLTGGGCTLSSGARIEVEAADEVHRRVVLERGTMVADIHGRFPVAVRTAAAAITVDDASAMIAVDELMTAVAVTRGTVGVTSHDGSRSDIPAGGRWSGIAGGAAARPIPCSALASKD